MLELPKFSRMAELLVLKRSCVFLCKLQLTWHTPPGDDKHFDLHDASFILKSLT